MIIDEREQTRKITIEFTASMKRMDIDVTVDRILNNIKKTIEKMNKEDERYGVDIEITIK